MTTNYIAKQHREFVAYHDAQPKISRFNSGYQDGYHAFERGWPNRWATENHFCEYYRQGFLSGYADAAKGMARDGETAWSWALLWGDIEG